MKPTELEMEWIKRDAEEKDVRAIIARDFSASRMSNTRWRQAFWSLAGIPGVRRVKFVRSENPLNGQLTPRTDKYLESSWGVIPFLFIEWLEINPIEDVWRGALQKPQHLNRGPEIERKLQAINVPYEWVDGNIRIVGYVRNDAGAMC